MADISPAGIAAARAVIGDVLARIAPDADLDNLDPNGDLQQLADLDSMDFLALVEGIAAKLSLDIPESDYDQLTTLGSAAAYLAERV